MTVREFQLDGEECIVIRTSSIEEFRALYNKFTDAVKKMANPSLRFGYDGGKIIIRGAAWEDFLPYLF